MFDEVFFFCKSNNKNAFTGFSRKESSSVTLSRHLTKQGEIFFKLQQDLMDIVYFFLSANLLTLKFERYVGKELLIAVIYRR